MDTMKRQMYDIGPGKPKLTRGELIAARDLQLVLHKDPFALESMLYYAAIHSPRRDYWRAAAAIHVCCMYNSQGAIFRLPPMALGRPVYALRLSRAWRMVGHYYAVALKTGLLRCDGSGRS